MWECGFFNSVNGDRLYNAQQMSAIFEGLITNGVYESVGDKMAVQPNNGMTIQIASGRGWFNRHWVNNDTEYTMRLEDSDVTLNRYCAVCVQVDDSDAVREVKPYLKYSDFATNPEKPTMERGETLNEYCLAYVYIKAGTTEIIEADIEDTRFNTELCGWVTGLIEQLNTTTLFTQWTDMFNNWFNNLVDVVNENTELMLVNALPVSLTVELSADKWADNQQTVSVNAMNTTKSVIVQANNETSEAYNDAVIKCISQDKGALTFSCENVPATSIKVDVLHMGV